MAFVDHIAGQSTGFGLRQRVARLLETPFDRRYRQRMTRIAALRAKSDEELSAMGLVRADIVSHVFGAKSAIAR